MKACLNILFLADPNSIHDVRWINFIAENENIACFLIARHHHHRRFEREKSMLSKRVQILSSIGDPSVVRPWRNLWYAGRIKKILRQHNIMVFHILYAEPNVLWAAWKDFFLVPLVATTHGTDILKTIPSFFRRKGLLNQIIANRYRRAFMLIDHITSTSFLQETSLKNLGINRPTTIVRTGVDMRLIRECNSESEYTQEIRKPFVLMPRNMKPIYNHEFTLDAIALLSPQVLEQYAFVFLNSDTPDQDYFGRIMKKVRRINADIRILGSLGYRDFLCLIRQSALVVMNPVSDGSPVTAMEAMALHTPVIIPPLEYDSAVFGRAWVFRSWTPDSLKEKIEEVLLADKGALARRIEENFSAILKEGNLETEMNKVHEIYGELNG